MRTLIIGKGEVGMSLYNVLKKSHEVFIKDIEPLEVDGIEVLNICFPYSEKFEDLVKEYQKKYNPLITIIHSTVKVGTSRKLNAVHSPIHGKHPNLELGIKTFVKYVGSDNGVHEEMACQFLEAAGIKVLPVKNQETSELSKLYCTTQYGINIAIMKEIHAMCEKYDADFQEAYQMWNEFYNKGYEELGMPQFRRYFLDFIPGKTGGHCVINNAKILKSLGSMAAEYILSEDEKFCYNEII